jgi:hypothetical protein
VLFLNRFSSEKPLFVNKTPLYALNPIKSESLQPYSCLGCSLKSGKTSVSEFFVQYKLGDMKETISIQDTITAVTTPCWILHLTPRGASYSS